jgi:hypothetical protein
LLVDHLHIVHVVCIFVDFVYCMKNVYLSKTKVHHEMTHRIHNVCRTLSCVHRKKLFAFLKYNNICWLTTILNFGSELYLFPCKNYSFLGLFLLAYFGFWNVIHSNRARYVVLHFQLNYECDVTGRNFHCSSNLCIFQNIFSNCIRYCLYQDNHLAHPIGFARQWSW